jgi:hypothetical protein
MIGHYAARARQQQRDATLDDFSTFCHDQVTRVRSALRTRRIPLDPAIRLGDCQRHEMPPESFDLTVRA